MLKTSENKQGNFGEKKIAEKIQYIYIYIYKNLS